MDFDETRLYYSRQALQTRLDNQDDNNDESIQNKEDDDDEEDGFDMKAVRRHFREFLRECSSPFCPLQELANTLLLLFRWTGNYRMGQHRYLYREKLLRMHRRRMSTLEVDLSHVGEYDGSLLGLLLHRPSQHLNVLELAAMDALKTLLYEQQQQQETVDGDVLLDDDLEESPLTTTTTTPTNDDVELELASTAIQVLLKGNLTPTPLRSIQSQHMNQLLKCPGIVISTSPVRSRATQLTIRCSRCLDVRTLPVIGGPYAGTSLPNRCSGAEPKDCGPYPYAVVPDQSTFCDRQSWKLQEPPETVPTGELPRSVLVVVERSLVDKAPPGTRVSLLCVPTLFRLSNQDSVQSVYLRVVGLQKATHGSTATFTPDEESAFRQLSQHPNLYQILSRSMAPSISGSYTVDIKKALLCLLMGGSRKRLPDGISLRGDINVLLLGDPSTAKSQFLKFASRVAPIGIYTSGKGSSAAGLTASVVRDKRGEFYLEGGAMVLADGGLVAIDEFDKMRPQDRVAIHEAMEQQTISVAKAGITTVLNSRSSVLAAANPVFGRYDDYKSASENIDLMTTILSRFDLIFLVRDVRDEERDKMICHHVMGVHMSHEPNRNNPTLLGSERYKLKVVLLLSQTIYTHVVASSSDDVALSADAIAENVRRVASTGEGELEVASLKKYIQYCRSKCMPILSEEAGDILASSYVKIRNDVRLRQMEVSRGRKRHVDEMAINVLLLWSRRGMATTSL